MEYAIVTDEQTGRSFRMDAVAFEAQIAGNDRLKIETPVADWKDRFVLLDPDRAVPMVFRATHWRHGFEEKVSACFARAAGYGDHDHVFQPKVQARNLKDAMSEGKTVLLSLNMDLSYRALNFRHLRGGDHLGLENWISNHRDYISVSMSSAAELRQTLKDIFNQQPDYRPRGKVYALYRGGVMPYANLYLAANEQRLGDLYDDMQDLKRALPRGETRAIGFPRLFRFVPTKSTLEQKGMRGLKGNVFWRADDQTRHISQLVFSDDIEKTPAEQIRIFETLRASQNGVYVLAAPTISRGAHKPHLRSEWRQTRWIINDFDRQVTPAFPAPAPEA